MTPTAPDLSRPSCSSRECTVYAEQPVRTQRMEIQYRSEAEAWTSLPASVRCLLLRKRSRAYKNSRTLNLPHCKPELPPLSHQTFCLHSLESDNNHMSPPLTGTSDPGSAHLLSPAVPVVPFQGQGQIQHRNVEPVERRCFQLDPRGG